MPPGAVFAAGHEGMLFWIHSAEWPKTSCAQGEHDFLQLSDKMIIIFWALAK